MLFQELMQRGWNARQPNFEGFSALDVAAACGNEDTLRLFAREEEV
jgi:hypothetical protein